jgi:HK97 gp10 family phage protein
LYTEVHFSSNWAGTREELERLLKERVEKASLHLTNETKRTLSGQRHGREYFVPGTGSLQRVQIVNRLGRRQHVYKRVGASMYTASAPGEAPAVRTGNLRRRIRYEMQPVTPAEIASKVGSPDEYSVYLEHGTRKMAARPFLRRTYEEQLPALKRILGEPL